MFFVFLMWVQVYDNDAGRGVTVATIALCAPMAPLGKLGLSLGRSEICFYLGNLSWKASFGCFQTGKFVWVLSEVASPVCPRRDAMLIWFSSRSGFGSQILDAKW